MDSKNLNQDACFMGSSNQKEHNERSELENVVSD
jgi:hypothetical protein